MLSGQVESAYLEALAGTDREGYTEMQATINLALTQPGAGVLRAAVTATDEEVKVSQALRGQNQADTLEDRVAAGASTWEQHLLDSY